LYYLTQGEFYFNKNNIIFINQKNETAIQIDYEDNVLFKKIINKFDGLHTVKEISNYAGVKEREVFSMIEELENMNMIYPIDNPVDYYIGIIENKDFEIERLGINIVKEKDFSNLSSKLLIGVSHYHDYEYFRKIHYLSMSKEIPWLKISIDEDCIILGPLFSHTGGPCIECLFKRISINVKDAHELEKISNNEILFDTLIPFIKNEARKFTQPNTPTHLFNREISININTYEIIKTRILKYPSCC